MFHFIYDVFLTCEKNKCPDLVVVALPMTLSDIRNGTREYVSQETDVEALHGRADELTANEREIARFIGRHYDALVKSFQSHDRSEFEAAVDQCILEEKEDNDET